MFLLGFILPGTLCFSWTWLIISFPLLGKFSAIQIFSQVLSLCSSWDHCNVNVGALMLSQRSLRLSSLFFFSFFFCILFCVSDFCHSVLQVIHPCFCLHYSALDSFHCVVHLCLLFGSSASLVNISCIFSVLFLRSWIMFNITILNYFSRKLPISTSFNCLGGLYHVPSFGL